MKRVIHFTRLRWVMFSLSTFLLIGGIVGTIVRGGFNIGIDFRAGLSEQIQVAPPALTIAYSGQNSDELTMTGSSVTVTVQDENGTTKHTFAYSSYATLQDLKNAITQELPDVTINLVVDPSVQTSRLIGIGNATPLGATPYTLNVEPAKADANVTIEQVRSALTPMGETSIQVVGNPQNQEFNVRVEDKSKTQTFQKDASAKIMSLLEGQFGPGHIVVKQSDYVGPRFSQNLASEAFTLTILALVLIMVYIWLRFRLAYAVSAAIATIHDPLIMIGFIGTFQLEVNTATIAAVLTIIGYSLNDTVVVFDRIRENSGLMRDTDFRTVIDTSLSQVLSRTIITSLVTQLAVLSILIFGTGSIQEFAINLTIGIVVGTYSSIFIAAQVLLLWVNGRDRRKKRLDAIKYGTREVMAAAVGAGASGEEQQQTGNEGSEKIELAIPHAERKLKGKRKKRGK